MVEEEACWLSGGEEACGLSGEGGGMLAEWWMCVVCGGGGMWTEWWMCVVVEEEACGLSGGCVWWWRRRHVG